MRTRTTQQEADMTESMNNICPICKADKLAWQEVFGEQHTCEYPVKVSEKGSHGRVVQRKTAA